MSDNLKRYCATLVALKQWYPSDPTGNLARHLTTLAALVSGIVGSKKTNLPAIANKIPDKCKRESRIKRFLRFLQNKAITWEDFFLPYVQTLIASLPPGPLVLVMDGSQIGRDCMALMLSVVYQQGESQRALPLCWQVIKAPKGHFSQECHQKLLAQAQTFLPFDRRIIFLGDGEFDGCNLLAMMSQANWQYVCRTAKNTLLQEEDRPEEIFTLSDLISEGVLRPGDTLELTDLLFTAQGFGPLLVGAIWGKSQTEPLFLVTNLDFLHEARFWYKKRFGIETFFSDQKSRGFYLCHSHFSDPKRLFRLLIATCLAYYWMVCLGAQVRQQGGHKIVHRTDRCDLSFFQLGWIWLEHCLNEGWDVPVILRLQNNQPMAKKSVR